MPSNSDTYIKFGADIDEFNKKVRTVNRRLDELGVTTKKQIPAAIRLKDAFSEVTSSAKKLAISVGVVTGGFAALLYAISRLTNPASDLQESMSKTEQIFGRMGSRSMFKWADEADKKMGASAQQALELSSTMGNMFSQLGLGREKSGELSRGLLQLSADIASFNNVAGGAAQVSDTMLSAFRGEYDALQRYIPTIKAASVQQQALADTGKESVKELTELDKALAAVNIITRDAGAAVGDFERTSDGYANTTRRLSAEWDNFAAILGQKFLPAATKIKSITADILDNLSKAVAGPSLDEQLESAKLKLEELRLSLKKSVEEKPLIAQMPSSWANAADEYNKRLNQAAEDGPQKTIYQKYIDVYKKDDKELKTTYETMEEALLQHIERLENLIEKRDLIIDPKELPNIEPLEELNVLEVMVNQFERLDKSVNNFYGALISGGPDAVAELQRLDDIIKSIDNDLLDFFGDIDTAGEKIKESFQDAGKEIKGTFDDAARAAQTAMRSMMDASESGSQGYAAMEVAIQAVNAVLAVSAVLNQASGDPYTAFARMAAMAATVISLGQSIGGYLSGGDGATAQDRSSPTTGTVLGSAESASQSIANSMEMLDKWNDLQYNELRGIHDEMRELNSNLTAVSTALVRSVGAFSTDLFSAFEFGPTPAFEFGSDVSDLKSQINDLFVQAGGLFGQNTSLPDWVLNNAITDTLNQERFSAVLSAIPEHLIAQAMEDIFGKNQITDIATLLPDLASDIFGSLLGGIMGGERETELRQAGVQIGGTTIANILDGIQAGVRQYGLIRITEDGGWFGSDSTSYARAFFDASDDTVRLFNQVYSDMATVLVSLAQSFEVPLEVIRAYDLEMQRLNLMDLNGEEIQQRLTEWASTILDTAVSELFGEIIGKYQKIDEGMLETATRLLSDLAVVNALADMTRTSINATGLAAYDMSEALIALAGDLDTLTENVQTYYEAFISEGERHQDLIANLTEYFSQLGVAMPESRDGFRALVEGLDLTTAAGQQLYVALTGMAEAMDAAYSAQEEIRDTTDSLVENLSRMVVPLTEYEQTVQSVTDAVEDAKQTWIDNGVAVDQATSAAQSMINYFVGAVTAMDEAQTVAANAKATLESIQAYRSSLGSSGFSMLMPDQVLANALTAFRAGDLADLPTLADTLLEAAKGAIADPAEYQRIFDEVSNRLASAEQEAKEQVDMAALQVSILQEQINQLENVNLTLEGIEDLLTRFTGGGFADGGISTGPTSGHIEMLHGDEAVVPLNNGAIPVQVYGGGDEETKALLRALIAAVSEDKVLSRKIYRVLDRVAGGENSFQTRTAD